MPEERLPTDLTAEEARASVERTKRGLAALADEIITQITGRAWLALGYASWDEMREVEYSGAAVIVPRADRPQLSARLVAEGLSQKQIADTLGVDQKTVSNDVRKFPNVGTDSDYSVTRLDALGRVQPRVRSAHEADPVDEESEPRRDPNIPVWGSVEARTADVVQCYVGHLAARDTFEDVGGCPYCLHTQGERMAALQARQAAEKRLRAEYEAKLAAERAERERLEREAEQRETAPQDEQEIIRQAREIQQRRKLEAREWTPEPVADPIPPPDGKYQCIVIDPPWPMQKIERDERPDQGRTLDYPVMSLEDIADERHVPVRTLAADDCHIYLWVTHKFLPAGMDLLKEWGFRYQCVMTWRKNVGITPFSWMYDTEHVLFGRKGNLKLQQLGLRLSFEAPVCGHSVKPDVFYERVIQASPGPRVEMFSRTVRDGFTPWGNEVSADGLV